MNSVTETGSPLMTREQAAAFLNVSLASLDRLRRKGVIDSLPCFSRPRFRKSDLERLVQQGSNVPAEVA